jgi:hypothetical protein
MLQIIAAVGVFFPTFLTIESTTVNGTQVQRIQCLLREVTNRGADLYNRGDANGCYRLYEGALLSVRALAEEHVDWQNEISEAFDRAAAKPQVAQRAFVLREVIDRIRSQSNDGASAKR